MPDGRRIPALARGDESVENSRRVTRFDPYSPQALGFKAGVAKVTRAFCLLNKRLDNFLTD
jgi:hypothetical protein